MTPLPRDAFPHAVATPRLRLRKPERGDDVLLAGLIFEAYASRPDPLSQERAVEVGSVDAIVSVARLRPALIEAIERGLGR